MDTHDLSLMQRSDGECAPVGREPTTELSAPCNSQESTRNYVKERDQARKASPHPESCLPSTSQKGVERSPRDMPALGEDVLDLDEQKLWQVQKEELEKELYDCTKAHKMSILRSAYEMSKLQVSFVLVKRQESLAKEQLEDALGIVNKLQTKVERLNSQLRHTDNENKRLNTALSTLTAEKESLQRALEAAKKTITNNSVKSVDVVEMWTEETAPLIAQHELETKQLQKIESNMATGKGRVTDQNVLEKWTEENEALHSATIQLQELQEKLAVSERLESDLATSKLDLEKVTEEKEELLIRLEATTKDLVECKKKIAETELHDAELGRYAQVLNVEKITLMGQLELLRGELDKQKEAARIAQIGANKAMEAERECAKALKLVEEKEEEMEYYMKQLESLREKNSMLRTQLDMEQQCKEAEMAAVPKLHEQSTNLLSRNLNTSMELVASNSIQNPQRIPPEPTTLHVPEAIPEAIPEAVEKKKSSKDNSRHEPLQQTSGKGKGRSATEVLDEMPNPEPDAVQPPTKLPVKRSSRLRNRVNTQHSTDSASATTGVRKQVIDLVEEDNDEIDGVIEDVTQTNRRSVSRLKRPPVLVPTETETSKKKGRKKYLNARSTDVELGPAHLLVRRSDRDERAKNLLSAAGTSDARRTPLRSSITPRTGSRLPR